MAYLPGLPGLPAVPRAKICSKGGLFTHQDSTRSAKAPLGPGTAAAFNDILYSADPHINVLFDTGCNPLGCNPAALQFFGFADEAALVAGLQRILFPAGVAAKQGAEGEPTLAGYFEKALQQGDAAFETMLEMPLRKVPVRITLKRVNAPQCTCVAMYMADLTTVQQAQINLINQDKLLQQINTIATNLMFDASDNFHTTIYNALKALGEAADVDRAYIWQNYEQDGRLFCRQVYEWSEGAEPQQGKSFTNETAYDSVPAWRDNLQEGKSINSLVREMGAEERATLEPQGIKSIFTTPIFLHGHFWGFMGFDDCRKERVFSPLEEKILQSGAILIVSAILRGEATENLIAAREDALASAKAKSEFFARMSHEIRTPMNAIMGMTGIARKSRDFGKIQNSLAHIDEAAHQLLEIINDILDMSKIEGGRFEVKAAAFDFEKMVQRVFSALQSKGEEKGQNFTFNFETLFTRNVISDELRLSQVITHLLSNAIKFTPEGGEITLNVRQVPKGPDEAVLHVEVKDNGIGIAPDMQAALFDSFDQVDGGSTRKYGGVGLGLAICKRILTLMDGEIWVESVPGEGSTFAFEVDIGWGAPLAAQAKAAKPRSGLHTLVVDDSDDVRSYFKNILSSFALHCDVAASGGEALEMVSQAVDAGTPYDLIFVDWKMPGMNGGETAREIKGLVDTNTIVIMISASDWYDIESEVEPYGVTEFLPKPILPSVLYNTIVRLTENTLVTPGVLPTSFHHWADKAILLVEDMAINREILMAILEETCIGIEVACNGLQAVQMFGENPERYDMILMDVQMPEMDGLEATRRIRTGTHPRASSIPIIAMTANAFREDVENCLKAGMNEHIAKPIDVEKLMNTLATYLEQDG